ncbi:MAG: hypothetical protein WD060_04760 [Pirellulales bacterium]
MRLFLDSSIMIAAAASATGASRAVFRESPVRDWRLLTTPYAVGEVVRNLAAFPVEAAAMWLRLRAQRVLVDDVLTLDRADFGRLLGSAFYGLEIMTPGMWLARDDTGGRSTAS